MGWENFHSGWYMTWGRSTVHTKRAQSEAMTSCEIERLVETDRLTETQLQAMSVEELAELRRIMLRALQLDLRLAMRHSGA